MNRESIKSIASGVTSVAIGLAIGLAALSGSASASTPDAVASSGSATHAATTALTPSAAGPRMVLLGCNKHAEIAPPSISSCRSAAAGLRGLHWTSWTPRLASGFGTYVVNDCKPSCAAGHLHAYPALVALWGSAVVKGHPAERKYAAMTLIFTGARPPIDQVVNGKTVVTNPVSLTFPTFP